METEIRIKCPFCKKYMEFVKKTGFNIDELERRLNERIENDNKN
jgi:hypothetical protein